jgi:hypothetical protein
LAYGPPSSLPVEVLAWLLSPPVRAGRATHLCRGDPPDAVAAVVLDGLSYRRAEPMVGVCKTEVGASMDLLLGVLAALGGCQPDRPARHRDR